MLTFLAANLGYMKTPLALAMSAMLNTRKQTGTPGMEVAFGWHLFVKDTNIVVWHDGGTGGYRSFIAYDPKASVGVVVLANTATTQGVADIGLHLLNEKSPLLPAAAFAPPREHKEVSVNPKLFLNRLDRAQIRGNSG